MLRSTCLRIKIARIEGRKLLEVYYVRPTIMYRYGQVTSRFVTPSLFTTEYLGFDCLVFLVRKCVECRQLDFKQPHSISFFDVYK